MPFGFTAFHSDEIKLWKLKAGKEIRTLPGHSLSTNAVASSSNGQTLVSAGGDKTIRIWDLNTGSLRQTPAGRSASIRSLAISPVRGRLWRRSAKS